MPKNMVKMPSKLGRGTHLGSLKKSGEPGRKNALDGAYSFSPSNQIAAETAHDLNNALGSIRLYVDLLEGECGDAGKVRQHLQQMKPAVEIAAGLVRQLSGLDSIRRVSSPISLNMVLEGMGPMLSTLPRRDVALRLRLSPSLALVAIDPAHVIRIVLNLVLNACDAMPQGGEVMIETSNWRVESQAAKRRPGSKPMPLDDQRPDTAEQSAGWVMMRVRDTGKGMSDATRERAFQPFFTSKLAAKTSAKSAANLRSEGAGLGLPSVLRMVENAGGTIQVESTTGKGTDITMLFPGGAQKVRLRQNRQQRKRSASVQAPSGSGPLNSVK